MALKELTLEKQPFSLGKKEKKKRKAQTSERNHECELNSPHISLLQL